MNANELAVYLEDITDSKKSPYRQAATMLRQQQAEIDALKKYIAESNALDKKLHESIQKANEVWGKATKSILKKAKE
jgi:uncharacterized phage infection (PIP) family protein YhgE